MPLDTVAATADARTLSPLMLSHHLLSLAEDAHRAGLPQSAARLLRLAHTVCTDRPAMR